MIIPMLCVTIFVILVVWFLLPRVARLMIHTPTAISIFVCLSMVQLMAVFISMRCTLCGHFLQVALTLILVVGYAIDRKSGSAGMPRPISYAAEVYPLSLHDALPIYYFRDIGRMVLAAEGRKANDSHADCYQYFCVPEYGTANGRLHFHAVHFMRTLPTGSVDPNFGRRVRNRRQLNSLQNTWPYGYSMPIAVRYTQDAFSRSGWLWPVDAKGEPLKATSYMAVGFYVAKYVNKKSDMDLAAKGLGAKEWNNSLKTKLSLLPKKLFRIRMS